MADPKTASLTEVLDRIEAAGSGDTVSVGQILDQFGDRTLAPVLLVPALLTVSPLSGIPGVPTLTGIVVSLIVVQMLLGRSRLWVPGAVARQCVGRDRLGRALDFLRRPVGWLDGLMRPRLVWLTERPSNYAALALCLLIAVATPVMELLPFAITIAAAAIALFAAGLLMRDGVVMLLGYGVVGLVVALVLRLA